MSSNSKDLILEINDKMQIARNIIVNVDRINPHQLKSDSKRMVEFYSGVNLNTIEEVLKNTKRTKSFAEWYELKSDINKKTNIDFERMRRIILDQYVNDLTIPTRKSILEAIKRLGYKTYSISHLDTDLYRLGYVWKRLPKSNKYIIVENTEQVSRRIKYFNKIKEYRDQNRCIVYFELVDISAARTDMILVASPQWGLLDTYFDTGLEGIDLWLINRLHTAPENAVFVIEQQSCLAGMKCRCELPTIHSQKKQMKQWLDLYNIPYDSNAHKCDLFALIEKYKVNCLSLYRSCEILKARGHDCLFRPPELTETKYSKFIEKNIQITAMQSNVSTSKTYVADYMTNVKLDWLAEDRILAEKENTMYEEDKKMELILDKLMDSVKNEGLNESDFAECDDNVLDSEFYDSILYDSLPPRSYIPK